MDIGVLKLHLCFSLILVLLFILARSMKFEVARHIYAYMSKYKLIFLKFFNRKKKKKKTSISITNCVYKIDD